MAGPPKISSTASSMLAMDQHEGIEKIEVFLARAREAYKDPDDRDWSSEIVRHLSVVSHAAAPARAVTFRFEVGPAHDNGTGNLHGGCAATLFDVCTTLPLCLEPPPGAPPGFRRGGVTRSLALTCLRPAPVGAAVHVRCRVLQAGRHLALVRGEMRAAPPAPGAPEGPLLAVCEHAKVNTDPPSARL
ncbi:HotDog domain-containing protein [Durotheca rogersii]|uniref:HotDog domain-containing protein n=1 Tax=Durotheca rogersii TaxID=419775 RepID=UPI0022204B38|nr:HotDog domain-containing protein [Durotheca rogersii]KAI5860419.1 HotDog domain-containing protein [Durotheca rogersii]